MLSSLNQNIPKEQIYSEIESLLISQGYTAENISFVRQAYLIAAEAHKEQVRRSGEPYITHPLKVALILAHLGSDIETIAAGILHDVLEDTKLSEEELKDKFGDVTLAIVEGVTKLGKIHFTSQRQEQAENFRKLVLAIATDVRVLLVKLADRLHNMHTLHHLGEKKQKRIARETLEIFAPLANRFGLNFFKWRLEDLAFKHLEPDSYHAIEDMVTENRATREDYLTHIKDLIEENVSDIKLRTDVTGRVKHFYSIHNKIQRLQSDQIFDLLAIRVIVDTEKECYVVLGVIHDLFQPLPGRFKDYIALPKTNGYRSLHTTVIGPQKKVVEIQIRTREMHKIAEYGVAAHWKYKEEGASVETRNKYDSKISDLRHKLIAMKEEIPDASDYNQAIKIDLFTDEIFVFSPKGDVFPMPRGATPVDFAYYVHTGVGDTCIGAKVNGHMVTLDKKLRNGDIVEILTNKNSQPSLDWLSYVKSNSTKSRIKHWFRKNKKEEHIERGRSIAQDILTKVQYDEFLRDGVLATVSEKLGWGGDVEELFSRIGLGEVSSNQLLGRLRNLGYLKKESDSSRASVNTSKVKENQLDQLKNFMHSFAKCCQPIPGEEIVGAISRNKGIVIHRENCPNLKDMEPERIMPISWDNASNKQETFQSTIEIECIDRVGMSRDILDKIAISDVNIVEIRNAKASHKGIVIIRVRVEIDGVEKLNTLLNSISSLADVLYARRYILGS